MEILWLVAALGLYMLLSRGRHKSSWNLQEKFFGQRFLRTWISWYQEPEGKIVYLAKDSAGEFYYTPIVSSAFRFDTATDARHACPVYDGSADISKRVGVLES